MSQSHVACFAQSQNCASNFFLWYSACTPQGRSKRSVWSGFGRTNNRAGRKFLLTAETTQSLFGVYISATVLQQACSPPIVNNLKPFSLYFCWNAFGSRGSAPDPAGGLAARPRPPTGSFIFILAGPIIHCLLRACSTGGVFYAVHARLQ